MIKSLKENLRDWKVLTMTVLFAPFFLILMFVFYGGEPTIYTVAVLNLDGNPSAQGLVKQLEQKTAPDGRRHLFKLQMVKQEADLKQAVNNKTADVGIVIPADYAHRLRAGIHRQTATPAEIAIFGSMANNRYPVAAVYAADVIQTYSLEVTGRKPPVLIEETFLEQKLPLNEFEGYVPGLLSLAILMILFTATASLVRESEKKTLVRLKLSRLGAFSFLAGTGAVQAVIAVCALVAAYLTALALGYRPAGSFAPVLLVGALSSLAIVAISLVLASFLRTVFDVLTIGCFPFFILMFFSGSMFPQPKLPLLSIPGHTLSITDLLPLTHTATAFNRILNGGAGFGDIGYELAMLTLLTALLLAAGLHLYNKRRLSRV
jgi:ABC-2 type transport system permease protein